MQKPYEIVIPLFNDELNFVNLLDSLVRFGISPSDVIVSQSGMRGNIDELEKEYRFRLIYSGQLQNPAVTRNRGAGQVKADYIVFLDSDVLITEEWAFALDDITCSGTPLLTGDTVHISATPDWLELFWFDRIERENRKYLNGANIVIQRELFERLGGFDELLDSGEDYDLSMRATELVSPPVLNDRFKVFHEGYPKSIKAFIKRERWHASGDVRSLKAFFKSNVMLAVALYVLLAFSTLFSLFTASWQLFSFSISFFLLFPLALTIYKIRWRGKSTFVSVVVMNLYLAGRGWALVESLLRPIDKLFSPSRRGIR